MTMMGIGYRMVSVGVRLSPPSSTLPFAIDRVLAAGHADLNRACRPVPVPLTRCRPLLGVSLGRCSSSLSPFRRCDGESV